MEKSYFVSMRHKLNGSIFVFELAQKIENMVTSDQINFEDVVRQACIATSKHQVSGIDAPPDDSSKEGWLARRTFACGVTLGFSGTKGRQLAPNASF